MDTVGSECQNCRGAERNLIGSVRIVPARKCHRISVDRHTGHAVFIRDCTGYLNLLTGSTVTHAVGCRAFQGHSRRTCLKYFARAGNDIDGLLTESHICSVRGCSSWNDCVFAGQRNKSDFSFSAFLGTAVSFDGDIRFSFRIIRISAGDIRTLEPAAAFHIEFKGDRTGFIGEMMIGDRLSCCQRRNIFVRFEK